MENGSFGEVMNMLLNENEVVERIWKDVEWMMEMLKVINRVGVVILF